MTTSPGIPGIEKLRRFCYIGRTDEPYYLPMVEDLIVEIKTLEILQNICNNIKEAELVQLLDNVLHNAKYLPRRDEALLILTTYLSTQPDFKQRTLMRYHFSRLVVSDRDLFIVMKFANRMQILLKRRTPFNRTLRKAVNSWYKTKSLDALLHMWSMEYNNHTHRDLLRFSHYDENELEPSIRAALRLFFSHSRDLMQWPAEFSILEQFKDIIVGIAQIRHTDRPTVMMPIIQKLSLTFDHVPRRSLTDVQVINAILPTMTYEQLLDMWPLYAGRYLFNQNARMNYLNAFCNTNKLREANLSPIRFLMVDSSDIKIRHARDIEKIQSIYQNPPFMHKLYNLSFGLNTPMGVRLNITMNLEKNYLKKTLNRPWSFISYVDAIVALGFGYFKTEEQVTVQYWNDKSSTLKLLPWTSEMTPDEALACCVNQGVLKVKQSLTEILLNALKDQSNTYNAFLVLVPGAARGNPKHSSETLSKLLDRYREERSVNAKFIIFSLRNNRKSMDYSTERNENILELSSLHKGTSTIVKAFIAGEFN